MQTVKKFSGSVNAPKKASTFDFTQVSDGNIYKAAIVDDYTTQKGFLVALTRYANGNNLSVNRYAHADGSYVEFQLVANPTPEAAVETPETPETENASEEF